MLNTNLLFIGERSALSLTSNSAHAKLLELWIH